MVVPYQCVAGSNPSEIKIGSSRAVKGVKNIGIKKVPCLSMSRAWQSIALWSKLIFVLLDSMQMRF